MVPHAHPPGRSTAVRLIPALLAASVLHGQDAPAEPVLVEPAPAVAPLPAAPDDEFILLDDFVVAAPQTTGYLQTNSNSGTRLNANIKDLPMPVEVITAAFLEDTGALTIQDALQFTAGLETQITNQQQGENPSETGFRLRGKVAEAALRNGFRRIGSTDTFNIQQVDVVRGPNALLYGIGNFGGVVNYVTDRPLAEKRSRVGTAFGSNGFLRGDFSTTGPIDERKTLTYRFGGFYQEEEESWDNARTIRRGYAPVIQWQATKNTRIMMEIEILERFRTLVENPYGVAFRVGGGVPYADQDFYPEDPTNNGLFNLYPYEGFRRLGPDYFSEEKDAGFLLEVEHKFSNNLKAYGGYYYSRTDDFTQTPSLSIVGTEFPDVTTAEAARLRAAYPWVYNPADPRFDAWYDPFSRAFSYNWSQAKSVQVRDQFRFDLAYSREIFKSVQTLIAGYTFNSIWTENRTTSLRDTSRPRTGDNPYIRFEPAYSRLKSIYDFTPVRFEPLGTEQFVAFGDKTRGKIWERGYYLVQQGSFMDGRLRTVAGLRWDWIHSATQALDPTTGTALPHRHRPNGPAKDFNTSVGVSWSPSRESPFAFYLLNANALTPIYSQTLADGFVPDPESGVSYEFGVKFDLFRKGSVPRLSGALAAYSLESTGAVVSIGTTPYTGAQIGVTSASLDPNWVAQGRGNSSANSLRDDESRGVDLQIIFTDLPISNLQTVLNLSYNDYNVTRIYGPSFDPATSDPRNGVYNFVTAEIAPDPNRRNNDQPEYSARLWAKYEFKNRLLKGFDIGFGARWTDKREAQYDVFDRQSYKIMPDRTVLDAAIGYKRKFFGRDTSIRANLYNLADDDEVYGYSLPEGFSFRLSARVNF